MDGIKEAVKNMDEKGKEWAENMQAKGKATGEMLREERIKLDIKAKATFMPGMFIRNEHDKPVTPLHWVKVEPGATEWIDCGKVWFTISTDVYEETSEPTQAGVAARIAAIAAGTAATVMTGGVFAALAAVGVVAGGAASAVKSTCETKMHGVLADGKTVVVATGEENSLKFNEFEPLAEAQS